MNAIYILWLRQLKRYFRSRSRLIGSLGQPLLFLVALGFVFLIALLFTALGTAIASLLEDMQGFSLIMNFLVMPIFFLSGALFPLDGLPKILNLLTKINPLAYGVDGLRGTLTGISHFSLLADFAVLSVIAALLLVIGGYLFSKIEI